MCTMVYRPTRGDAPARFGAGVTTLPAVGTATVSADVYRDPLRYELEVERVLRRSWMIAARSSELPNTNDS